MIKKNLYQIVSIVICLFIGLSGCDFLDSLEGPKEGFSGLSVTAADCTYGGEIQSVAAVDAHTVTFTLCKPDAAFPAKIAAPIFAIQDQAVLNATGGDSNLLSENPVGTGAFRLQSWAKAVLISLQPSSSYWGTPALPGTLEFEWHDDPAKRYGFTTYVSVDGIDIPPATLISSIKTNPQLKTIQHPLANVYYIGINNKAAPLDQVEVRRAITVALDRAVIVQQVFPQGSELAQQMSPVSVSPGHSDTLTWYGSNPRDAREQLVALNFDFNQEITIAVANSRMGYLENPGGIAALVKTQLEAIGLKVTIESMSLEEVDQAIRSGDTMLYINWFQADYADGTAYFDRLFVNEANSLGDPYPEIQQEIVNSLSTVDTKTRQDIFSSLNTLIYDQVPLIPLGYATNLSVFRSSVNNVAASAYYENFEDMSGIDSVIHYVGVREPISLWPADEDDYQTFRITRLLYDTLLMPGFSGTAFKPLLAENWQSSPDLTEWTFDLRYNVRFSNNATFDANDVVASFAAIWDASNPNHKGRTGEFAYYKRLFGNLLNDNQ
jgi:ABC-type transport system substrate-binding protein